MKNLEAQRFLAAPIGISLSWMPAVAMNISVVVTIIGIAVAASHDNHSDRSSAPRRSVSRGR